MEQKVLLSKVVILNKKCKIHKNNHPDYAVHIRNTSGTAVVLVLPSLGGTDPESGSGAVYRSEAINKGDNSTSTSVKSDTSSEECASTIS